MSKKTLKKTYKDDYTELRNKRKHCGTCWGYSLWAIGDPCPMGPMDYRDGSPTKKCPECGAGVRKNTWTTLDGLVIPVKDLTNAHLKNIVRDIKKCKVPSKMIEKEVKRRAK